MEIDRLNRTAFSTPVIPQRVSHDQGEVAAAVAAVRALNKSEMFGTDRQLTFARDRETQKAVIQIVDRNTGEMVQQIPAAELLRILADMSPGSKADLES